VKNVERLDDVGGAYFYFFGNNTLEEIRPELDRNDFILYRQNKKI